MMDRIPDWKLERYLLRELPTAQMQQLDRLLSEQEDLRRRLAVIEAEHDDVRQQYPAAWMSRQIERRAETAPVVSSSPGQFSSLWRWSPAMAIGLVAIIAIPHLNSPAPDRTSLAAESMVASAEHVRLKGAPSPLRLHRQIGSGSERLADRELAGAGDLIMVEYEAQGASHGLIFSVDGAGVVTRHLPLDGNQAAALGEGVVTLSTAYELDDAPAWEAFYLVTGDGPFAVEPVLQAAADLASGSEPPDDFPLMEGLTLSRRVLLKKAGDR